MSIKIGWVFHYRYSEIKHKIIYLYYETFLRFIWCIIIIILILLTIKLHLPNLLILSSFVLFSSTKSCK